MIAFGSVIDDPAPYRRHAEAGIRLVAEPDSVVLPFRTVGKPARTMDLVRAAAAANEDLEALVLLHPGTQIVDPAFCGKVREVLADPDVAVIGCAGATAVRGVAWWHGDVHAAPGVLRYEEHGGGELPAFDWADPKPVPAEVEAVDGSVFVLSGWAARTLRFEEDLWLGPGADVEYCRRARRAGKKVVAADLRVVHHRPLRLLEEPVGWAAAHVQMAERLLADAGDDTIDWRARARRAEAEREAAGALADFRRRADEARIAPLEEALAAVTASAGWRLTAPLRRLNALRRAHRPDRR